jgi:hypothetical protein
MQLRALSSSIPMADQQAAKVVTLADGSLVFVLGCPGGRVRVVRPGAFRTDGATPHGLGSIVSSRDLGHGGSALAVRLEGSGSNETVRIWFGTLLDHAVRPANYGTGSLGDGEVQTGGLHMLTWTAAGSLSTSITSVPLLPTSNNPRGGFGVVGLIVADLLPGNQGDELIVTTLAGDILVMTDTMQEIWRTHVHGAVGCHNAIRVEDLDNDGRKELYVAGSLGLWRFVLPGE